MPSISVIVTAYQVSAFLKDCLQSIAAQTFSDFEIIIIDDGSTDGSGQIANVFSQTDARAQVFHIPNAGPAAARNLGMEKARGQYIFIVDGDDLLPVDALRTLHDATKRNHEDIISANHEEFYPNGTGRIFSPSVHVQNRLRVLKKLVMGDSVYNITCNKLYKRSFLLANSIRQPADIRIGEDALMNLQAYAMAEAVAHVPVCTYRYRIHGASAMRGIRKEGEYHAHLPWLMAMVPLLQKLGLREACFIAYLTSISLRMQREMGRKAFPGAFKHNAKHLVLEGVHPSALSFEAKAFFFSVQSNLFPWLWVATSTPRRLYYALQARQRG